MKAQARIDEFAIILLAGVVLIIILALVWAPTAKAPPEVEPTSKTLYLTNGTSSTFDLTIIGDLTNVTLAATGEIRTWVTFSRNNFDVVNSTKVKVTVKVPERVTFRTYTGKIEVTSVEGSKSVEVNVIVEKVPTRLSLHPVTLGDFSVKYIKTSEVLDSKKDLEIYKSYFSEKSAGLAGIITETNLPFVKKASLHLVVEETNKVGSLIVLLNGEQIFNKVVDIGEVVIPINVSKLKETNIISIRADSPGLRFWTGTLYKIALAKFEVDLEGILPKDFIFSLEEDEVSNFEYLHLFYRVKDFSKPMPELIVSVNNRILYWGVPPAILFNETFRKDFYGNPILLTSGNNTISFSIEREGYIDFGNANLDIYYRG